MAVSRQLTPMVYLVSILILPLVDHRNQHQMHPNSGIVEAKIAKNNGDWINDAHSQ